VKWAAYDEVYGRSSELRRFCESGNLAYVAVVPGDFRVTPPPVADSPARPASPRSGSPSPRPPRIERLARQHAAGLIIRTRLAFCLRWSR
jgi:hypothetical protein